MVLTRSCYSILGTPLASSPNPDKINFSPGIRRSTRRRDSSQSTTIDHQSSSSSSPSINSYNSGKNHRIDSIKRQSSISAPNSPSPSSSSSSTNTNNTSQNLSQRLSSSTRLASETDLSSSCTTTQIQGSITEVSLDKPTPVTALGLVFRSKTGERRPLLSIDPNKSNQYQTHHEQQADQSEIKTLSSPLTPVSVSPPFDYNYQSDLKESVPEQIETEAEEVQANHHKEEPPTQESGELKQTVGPQEHSDLEPVEHSGEAETVEGGDSKPDQDQPEKVKQPERLSDSAPSDERPEEDDVKLYDKEGVLQSLLDQKEPETQEIQQEQPEPDSEHREPEPDQVEGSPAQSELKQEQQQQQVLKFTKEQIQAQEPVEPQQSISQFNLDQKLCSDPQPQPDHLDLQLDQYLLYDPIDYESLESINETGLKPALLEALETSNDVEMDGGKIEVLGLETESAVSKMEHLGEGDSSNREEREMVQESNEGNFLGKAHCTVVNGEDCDVIDDGSPGMPVNQSPLTGPSENDTEYFNRAKSTTGYDLGVSCSEVVEGFVGANSIVSIDKEELPDEIEQVLQEQAHGTEPRLENLETEGTEPTQIRGSITLQGEEFQKGNQANVPGEQAVAGFPNKERGGEGCDSGEEESLSLPSSSSSTQYESDQSSSGSESETSSDSDSDSDSDSGSESIDEKLKNLLELAKERFRDKLETSSNTIVGEEDEEEEEYVDFRRRRKSTDDCKGLNVKPLKVQDPGRVLKKGGDLNTGLGHNESREVVFKNSNVKRQEKSVRRIKFFDDNFKVSEESKSKRKAEGFGWGDLPRQEINDEVKREIRAMRLQRSLDPKRFIKGESSSTMISTLSGKKKNRSNVPEKFLFGHIVSADNRSSKLGGTKKENRKMSFVDGLIEENMRLSSNSNSKSNGNSGKESYCKRKFAEEFCKSGGGTKRQKRNHHHRKRF